MFSMVYRVQEQAGSHPEYLQTINSYTPEKLKMEGLLDQRAAWRTQRSVY
jgi:hypothetical protein